MTQLPQDLFCPEVKASDRTASLCPHVQMQFQRANLCLCSVEAARDVTVRKPNCIPTKFRNWPMDIHAASRIFFAQAFKAVAEVTTPTQPQLL